jgi:hypothetical protein
LFFFDKKLDFILMFLAGLINPAKPVGFEQPKLGLEGRRSRKKKT